MGSEEALIILEDPASIAIHQVLLIVETAVKFNTSVLYKILPYIGP
jgi:hypothetical protein